MTASLRKAAPGRREWLPGAFLLLLVCLPFSGLLTGGAGWTLDGEKVLLQNRRLLPRPWTLETFREAAFGGVTPNRPVANLSFALTWPLLGDGAEGHRILNALIHFAAALGFWRLFYFLILLTSGKKKTDDGDDDDHRRALRTGLLFAAAWAACPVQVQAVTYVVQRMTCLAGAFSVWALYFYVRWRTVEKEDDDDGRGFLIRGAVLWLLALGTKEIAVLLPLYVIVLEKTVLASAVTGGGKNFRKRRMKRLLGAAAGVCLVFAGLYLLQFHFRPHLGTAGGLSSLTGRDFTGFERLLTMPRVLVFYVSLLLWPAPGRLNLEHDFAVSRGLFSPASTLLALLLLFLVLSYALRVRRRRPVVSAGVLFFLAGLLLESAPLNLEPVFEHRLYLPSAGLIVLLVLGLSQATERFSLGPGRALRAAGTGWTITAVFLLFTLLRLPAWRSQVTLYEDCVKKSPGKARAWNNLGRALQETGRMAEAERKYERAISLDPDNGPAHINLGISWRKQGKPGRAVEELARGVALRPYSARGWYNLGNALEEVGRPAKAAEAYRKAVEIRPDLSWAWNNLGVLRGEKGRYAEAEAAFDGALRFDPRNAKIIANRGIVRLRLGKIAEARRDVEAALALGATVPRETLEKLGLDGGGP